MRLPWIMIALLCFSSGLSAADETAPDEAAVEETVAKPKLTLTSSSFQHGGMIPEVYTCKGEDVNPPLTIANVPMEARSLLLIVDDPDAPRGTWDHWIVFNINPRLTEIQENSTPGSLGRNSWGNTYWQGPCPPKGVHRYMFKLFALDTRLDLHSGSTKVQILTAAKGHVLDKALLIGRFQK